MNTLRRNFSNSLSSFCDRLRTEFLNDLEFRQRFDVFAAEIVEHAIAEPTQQVSEREREGFTALLESWAKAPQLRRIWLGLGEMRPTLLFTEVSTLFHIYTVVDVERAAAALLESVHESISSMEFHCRFRRNLVGTKIWDMGGVLSSRSSQL